MNLRYSDDNDGGQFAHDLDAYYSAITFARAALKAILESNDSRIDGWVNRHVTSQKPEMFEGFFAESWIAPAFVPRSIRQSQHPDDYSRLCERLERAICGDDCGNRDNFDWAATKRRIDAVLKEFGTSLLAVQQSWSAESILDDFDELL